MVVQYQRAARRLDDGDFLFSSADPPKQPRHVSIDLVIALNEPNILGVKPIFPWLDTCVEHVAGVVARLQAAAS